MLIFDFKKKHVAVFFLPGHHFKICSKLVGKAKSSFSSEEKKSGLANSHFDIPADVGRNVKSEGGMFPTLNRLRLKPVPATGS
jgi:hypothetical protein